MAQNITTAKSIKAKYAYFFVLKEPLAQDKLDQPLKINAESAEKLFQNLFHQSETGFNTFQSRNIQTQKHNYRTWLIDLFSSSPFRQVMAVVLSDTKKLDDEVYRVLQITKSTAPVISVLHLYPLEKNKGTNPIQSLFNNLKNRFKEKDEVLQIELKPEEKVTHELIGGNELYAFVSEFLDHPEELNKKDFLKFKDDLIKIENHQAVMIQNALNTHFEIFLFLFAMSQALNLALIDAMKRLNANAKPDKQFDSYGMALNFVSSYGITHSENLPDSWFALMWEKINASLKLKKQTDKLIEKLRLAKLNLEFVKAKQELQDKENWQTEKQKWQEEKNSYEQKILKRVTVFGCILVALSFLNFTPFAIQYFLNNWSDLILNFLVQSGFIS